MTDNERRGSTEDTLFNGLGLEFESLVNSPPPQRYDPQQDQGIDPELERLLEYDPGLMEIKAKSYGFAYNGTSSSTAAAAPTNWYSLPTSTTAEPPLRQPQQHLQQQQQPPSRQQFVPQQPITVVEQVQSQYLPKPDVR